MGGVRTALAPSVKRALHRSGVYAFVRRARPNRGLAILRYHAVCGPEGHTYAEPGICVSPEAFAAHIAYLTSHYSVLPLPDAAARLRDGRPLPENAVAITFDDGYADNLPAARVLHAHNASATFYITAGCLSGEAPFWPSELRSLVVGTSLAQIRFTATGQTMTLPLGGEAERRAAIRTASRLFKSNPIPVREALREELRRQIPSATPSSPMLTWDQVREMHRMGMTIGAHTVTHPNLPSAGLDDARGEIVGARARLQREIDAPVTMFSYPNGGAERYMTPEIAAIVREAGYEAATTSRNGFASRRSDLFALERVQVSERIEDLAFALEVERFAFKPRPRPLEA
jgi:peptidoglycan/xylan/chitin deacetylase (PgdA/CDA1 family)